MTDDDKARLDALAHLWDLSNSATIRRLIQQATKGLLPSERDGHTCPPSQFDRFGCSNPMAAKGACVACWPTPPTHEEQHQGEMQRIMLLGSTDYAPWWVHAHRLRQEREEEERQSAVDNERLAARLHDEALTWDIENERMPAHLRQCTAITTRGVRCSRRPMAGSFTTCKGHTRS